MPRTRRRTIPNTLWTILVAVIATIALTACASASTRHVAPTGADSGDCQSSPCKTFGYANGRAQPGDVVEVAGGSYAHQTIGATNRNGAVTFQPASGAAVSVADLDIAGGNVTIRNMSVGFVDIDAGITTVVRGVTLNNLNATGMYVQYSDGLRVLGGSFGPFRDGPMVQFGGSPASSNTTFDGVTFHDATTSDSAVHMECIWAGGVQGFTVRNSLFYNCTYFNIYLTTLNGPDPSNVLLENNVLEQTIQWNGQAAPYAVNISNYVTRAVNYTFRNNTFGGDVAFQSPSMSGVKFVNNIAPLGSCTSGVVYGSNVLTARTCGTGDRKVAGALSQFANPAAHDWHLKAGAAAINVADASNAPALDADGNARDAKPDVGAYEWGSVPPTGGSAPPAGGGVPPADAGTLPRAGAAATKTGAAGTKAGGGSGEASGTGDGGQLLSARLSSNHLCAPIRSTCRTGTLSATLVLTAPARLTGRIDRLRGTRKAEKVARFVRKLAAGRVVVKIPRTGLRRGHRYRIVLTATAADGTSGTRTVTFRVR